MARANVLALRARRDEEIAVAARVLQEQQSQASIQGDARVVVSGVGRPNDEQFLHVPEITAQGSWAQSVDELKALLANWCSDDVGARDPACKVITPEMRKLRNGQRIVPDTLKVKPLTSLMVVTGNRGGNFVAEYFGNYRSEETDLRRHMNQARCLDKNPSLRFSNVYNDISRTLGRWLRHNGLDYVSGPITRDRPGLSMDTGGWAPWGTVVRRLDQLLSDGYNSVGCKRQTTSAIRFKITENAVLATILTLDVKGRFQVAFCKDPHNEIEIRGSEPFRGTVCCSSMRRVWPIAQLVPRR